MLSIVACLARLPKLRTALIRHRFRAGCPAHAEAGLRCSDWGQLTTIVTSSRKAV
jgi:hypothetical protein